MDGLSQNRKSLNGLSNISVDDLDVTALEVDTIKLNNIQLNNASANKWVKTDSNKRLVTTTETPVLITGDQTIEGDKTFSDTIKTLTMDTGANSDFLFKRNGSHVWEVTEMGIEMSQGYKFYGDIIGTAFRASGLAVTRQIAGQNFNGTQDVVISSSDLDDGDEIVLNTEDRINKLSTTSDTNTFTYTFNLASSNKTFQKFQFQGNNSQILVLDANGSEFYSDVEIKDTQYLTYISGTANEFLKLDANKKMVSTTIASTDLSDSDDIVMDTGNQTIAGVKTFSDTITGNISGNAGTATNVAYSGLTGTVPTWNQDTTGTAENSNHTPYSGLTGTVPTWNQNTTGNSATATALATARNIAGQSFDGTANINIASTDLSNSDDIVMDTGNQTIAGEKTFTSKLTIGDTNKTTFLADNDVVIEKEGTTFSFWGGKGTGSSGTNYRFYGTDNANNYFTIDTTVSSKHLIKSTSGTLGFDTLNIETNGWVKLNSGTAHQWVKLDEYNKLVTDTLSVSDLSDDNTLVKTDDVRIDKISTTSTTNPHQFKYIFDLSSTNKTYQTYEFKGNGNLIAVFDTYQIMFYADIEILSTKFITYNYGTANEFLKLDANKKMVSTTIASTDLSDTSNIVLLDNTQTISGVKTFSSPIKVPNGTVMESPGMMRFWSNKGANSGGSYDFVGQDDIDNHVRITTGSTSVHYITSSTGNICFSDVDLLTYGTFTADQLIGETIKLTDGASVGKFLKCNNANGTAEWADAPGGGSPSGNISVDNIECDNIVSSTGSITTTAVAGFNFGNDDLTTTGDITASGGFVGNASTATALATARNIAGQSFDGTANIDIASTDLSDTSNIVLLDNTQIITGQKQFSGLVLLSGLNNNKFLKLNASYQIEDTDISSSDLTDGANIVLRNANASITGQKTFTKDIKLANNASVGKYLKCTNADGTGEWATVPGSSGDFGSADLTTSGELDITGGGGITKGDFGIKVHDTSSNTNVPIIIGEDPGTTYSEDGTVASFVGDTTGSHRVAIKNLAQQNSILRLQNPLYAFGLACLHDGSFGLYDYQNSNYKLFYNYTNGFNFTDRAVYTTGIITANQFTTTGVVSAGSVKTASLVPATGETDISLGSNNLTSVGNINTGTVTASGAIACGSLSTDTIVNPLGTSGVSFGSSNISTSGNLTLSGLTANQFMKLGSGSVVASTTIASTDLTDANTICTTDTQQTISGEKTFSDTIIGDITGNAGTATNVAYSGLTGTVPTWNQNTTGNSATATALATARNIAGQSFDGTDNIDIASTDLSDNNTIVKTTGNQTVAGDKTFTGDCAVDEVIRLKKFFLGTYNVPTASNEFKIVIKPTDFIGDDDDGDEGFAQTACIFDNPYTNTGYPQSYGGIRIDSFNTYRPDLVCQVVIPYGATATKFRINCKNFPNTGGFNGGVSAVSFTTSITDGWETLSGASSFLLNQENTFTSTVSHRQWSSSEDRILMFQVYTNSNWNTVQGGYVKFTI